jgi:hypothetical protein
MGAIWRCIVSDARKSFRVLRTTPRTLSRDRREKVDDRRRRVFNQGFWSGPLARFARCDRNQDTVSLKYILSSIKSPQVRIPSSEGCHNCYIHLLSLHSGRSHPRASRPILEPSLSFNGQLSFDIIVSGEYLGVLVHQGRDVAHLLIWDWTSGRQQAVRHVPSADRPSSYRTRF